MCTSLADVRRIICMVMKSPFTTALSKMKACMFPRQIRDESSEAVLN